MSPHFDCTLRLKTVSFFKTSLNHQVQFLKDSTFITSHSHISHRTTGSAHFLIRRLLVAAWWLADYWLRKCLISLAPEPDNVNINGDHLNLIVDIGIIHRCPTETRKTTHDPTSQDGLSVVSAQNSPVFFSHSTNESNTQLKIN